MPKKRFSPEQIIATLRQIEVPLAQGKSTVLACKDAAISEQSYYRWRNWRSSSLRRCTSS